MELNRGDKYMLLKCIELTVGIVIRVGVVGFGTW